LLLANIYLLHKVLLGNKNSKQVIFVAFWYRAIISNHVIHCSMIVIFNLS